MKKIVLIILMLALLCLSLVGCGKSEADKARERIAALEAENRQLEENIQQSNQEIEQMMQDFDNYREAYEETDD